MMISRRNAIAGLLATPLLPATAAAQDGAIGATTACRCVCMEERDGAFVLEGSGPLLTEPFEMDAGRYRIEIALSNPGRFDSSIWVDFYHRETGSDDGYFAEVFDQGVPEILSGSVRFRNGGEYVADVDFGGDWKIVLSPI